jgi:hypothetical protein
MANNQLSTDGGAKWTAFSALSSPVTFTLGSFEAHFSNKGANSFLRIVEGMNIAEVFISDGFTLKVVNDENLVVSNFAPADESNFYPINYGVSSASLFIAPNAGGIGIADIRDNGFIFRGVGFNIVDSSMSMKAINASAQVNLSFKKGYKAKAIEVSYPSPRISKPRR